MKKLLIPAIALIVIVLDQLTKAWIGGSYSLNQRTVLVPEVLQFRVTHNTGAAFGVLSGATGALAIAAVAIVVAIIFSATRMVDANRWAILALGLVVGGAVGNLIDRVRFGYVVDFIEVYGARIQLGGTTYTFPVFNVADSAITVGVLLLLVTILFPAKRQVAQNAS